MKDTTVDPLLPADVSAGSWKVSSFTSKNVDQTSLFAQYNFEFRTGSKLVANHSSGAKEGTWSEDKTTFRLSIAMGPNDHTNQPLGILSANWKLTKTSASRISAVNDNSANYETIEFTRN